MKTFIQSHLYKPSFKSRYIMKAGNSKAQWISKAKWFKLYDESKYNKKIVVLGPITHED